MEAAESYCEPWILEDEFNFRAYISDGTALKGAVVTKKISWFFGLLSPTVETLKLENTGQKNEALLKTEIISYLNKIEDLEEQKTLEQSSLEHLVELLVKHRGITR